MSSTETRSDVNVLLLKLFPSSGVAAVVLNLSPLLTYTNACTFHGLFANQIMCLWIQLKCVDLIV